MKTYGDLFQRHLMNQIKAGSEVDKMVTLVNMWQGNDPAAWQSEFEDWVHHESFLCENCYSVISFFVHPEVAPKENIDEDCLVLCRSCLPWGLLVE